MEAASLCKLLAFSSPRKRVKLETIQGLIPKLSTTEKCVDIGTAHGGLAYYYAKKGAWTFVDPDPKNLSIARKILSGQFVQDVAENIIPQLKDISLVTFVDTISYCGDSKELLKKIHHSLRPGGFVIISGTIPREDWLSNFQRILGLSMKEYGFEKCITKEDIENFALEIGFKVDSVKEYYHPVSFFFQSLLDRIILSDKNSGDRCTLEMTHVKWLRLKYMIALGLSVLSKVTSLLDILSKGQTTYAYALRLKKID